VTQTDEEHKNIENILRHLGGRILREIIYENQENGRRTTYTMPHTAQTLYRPVRLILK